MDFKFCFSKYCSVLFYSASLTILYFHSLSLFFYILCLKRCILKYGNHCENHMMCMSNTFSISQLAEEIFYFEVENLEIVMITKHYQRHIMEEC